jgi:hypothetical protein
LAAGRVSDSHIRAGDVPDAIGNHGRARRGAVVIARQEGHRISIGANDRHAFDLGANERQETAVFQQDDGFARGLEGQRSLRRALQWAGR